MSSLIRLTARSPKNNMAYLVNVKENEQALDGSYNTLKCVLGAFERLAVYEERLTTSRNYTLIEDKEISFNNDNGLDENLIRYCTFECRQKCGLDFMSEGTECDCVINRLYCAMIRLAELEYGFGLEDKS